VHFDDKKATVQLAQAKQIHRDLLFFPMTKELLDLGMKQARTAEPVVGGKVLHISFASPQAALSGKMSIDAGHVKRINVELGLEKMYYDFTTREGDCSAAVWNTDGKVVGFHAFGASGQNGGYPITKVICDATTGSSPTF
jgi:hypothetical protein